MLLLPVLLCLTAQEFEVVSVKPSNRADPTATTQYNGNGDVRVVNLPADRLVLMAYDLHESQLVAAPKWLAEKRFDVEARSGIEQADAAWRSAAMQDLLRKRFGLAAHFETRPMTVLALVQAKGGHKLKPVQSGKDSTISSNAGAISANGYPVSSLASVLANDLERIVVDETGLVGEYAFELRWMPEEGPYQALQNDLGLKLESKRLPVKVLVIDKISLPTEN